MRLQGLVLSVVWVCGCAESERLPEGEPGRLPALLPADSQPALGFLSVSNSLVVPWCAAVLVAPNVVVTAAHCVEDLWPSRVSFGLGRVTADGAEGGMYQVRDFIFHPEHTKRGPWQRNLAALVLEQPVRGITPARLGDEAAPEGRLTSVTYEYALPGQAGARRVWGGQAQGANDPITLVPTEGEPNCHGDVGAGVIDAAGNVLGFLSSGLAEAAPAHHRGGVYDGVAGCYQSYKIAAVAQNRPFIDQSINRASAPPVVP